MPEKKQIYELRIGSVLITYRFDPKVNAWYVEVLDTDSTDHDYGHATNESLEHAVFMALMIAGDSKR